MSSIDLRPSTLGNTYKLPYHRNGKLTINQVLTLPQAGNLAPNQADPPRLLQNRRAWSMSNFLPSAQLFFHVRRTSSPEPEAAPRIFDLAEDEGNTSSLKTEVFGISKHLVLVELFLDTPQAKYSSRKRDSSQ